MLYPSPRIAFEALKILTSRMSACNNMCQLVRFNGFACEVDEERGPHGLSAEDMKDSL